MLSVTFQGFDLTEPGGPWWLTFAIWWPGIIGFCIKLICLAPGCQGFREYGLTTTFAGAQPCSVTCCFVIFILLNFQQWHLLWALQSVWKLQLKVQTWEGKFTIYICLFNHFYWFIQKQKVERMEQLTTTNFYCIISIKGHSFHYDRILFLKYFFNQQILKYALENIIIIAYVKHLD